MRRDVIMAMNKNLEVGTILFTYTDAGYEHHSHRCGRHKYVIRFKALYVHNRRERTTGAYVPASLRSTLDKLGIRHYACGYGEVICAVGCRAITYHEVRSNNPYPTAEDVKIAQEKLEEKLRDNALTNGGIKLFEIEFVEKFKQKKMSNKDALFAIQKPLEEFINNETFVS